jgi:predicted nucleic acid-binding protein
LRGILDTSVFVALEQGRELDPQRIPDDCAISVVTLAELELGVHLAGSDALRAGRLATLGAVRGAYEALPITERVASSYSTVVARTRGIGRSVGVQDAWIAATAHAHQVAVYTQDAAFELLEGVDVVRV